MYIVPDANIIIAEGYGDSERFRTWLSKVEILGYNLYVPQLVIEEVVARFERAFDSDVNRIKNALDDLSRRLGKDFQSPIDTLDRQDESNLFRHRLEALFDTANCSVLDYPSVSHEELTKRAMQRIRPFNESGSGYRDALIWESVLRLALETSDTVVLLSNDNAFYDAKTGKIHDELAEELVGRGLPDDKVIIVRSLADFADAYIEAIIPEVHLE